MKWSFLSLAGILLAGWACADDVPSGGPKRLAWMREQLGGTVSKFEFTQGYYLVSPVKPNGAEVLVEVEHESCPYDGVHYARQGKINGTYPLLTANPVGKGLVVRHYAAVSPGAVFADAYPRLLANLLEIATTPGE